MKLTRTLWIASGIIAILALQSCQEEDPDPGIVNFEESSYNLTTDDLSPFELEFTIEPAAPRSTSTVSGNPDR